MGITEWLKKGWENYRNNAGTYVGVVILQFVALAILFGITLGALKGVAMVGDLEGFLYGFIVAAPLVILIAVLLGVYFDAALYMTASEDGGIGNVLRRALERYVSFLGLAILLSIIVAVPWAILTALGGAIGQPTIFTALALLLTIYLIVKFVTAKPLVALGRGAVEAVQEAWKVPFTTSLEVLIAALVVGITGAIVTFVLSLVPAVGVLLALIVNFFVVGPWGVATLVEATREATSR